MTESIINNHNITFTKCCITGSAQTLDRFCLSGVEKMNWFAKNWRKKKTGLKKKRRCHPSWRIARPIQQRGMCVLKPNIWAQKIFTACLRKCWLTTLVERYILMIILSHHHDHHLVHKLSSHSEGCLHHYRINQHCSMEGVPKVVTLVQWMQWGRYWYNELHLSLEASWCDICIN